MYPYRYDLLRPYAMQKLAEVLDYGAKKYGEENWRNVPIRDHLNHSLGHLISCLKEVNTHDLSHAFCRIMFALELLSEESKNEKN